MDYQSWISILLSVSKKFFVSIYLNLTHSMSVRWQDYLRFLNEELSSLILYQFPASSLSVPCQFPDTYLLQSGSDRCVQHKDEDLQTKVEKVLGHIA